MTIKAIAASILLLSWTATHADFKSCKQIHSSEQFKNNSPIDEKIGMNLFKRRVEAAYLKQACRNYVGQKEIIGYKAGLTSAAAQEKFNLTEPIFGVLNVKNKLENPKISLTEKIFLLEAELAFRIKKDIAGKSDINENISDLVDAVIPVVEVPSIDSKNIAEISIENIIENNVGVYKFKLGKQLLLEEVDINNIRVKIFKDKELYGEGVSNAPMGDQVKAIKWLIKRAFLEGYNIRKGDILLTGATTKPFVLQTGDYEIDFDRLGIIDLSVE